MDSNVNLRLNIFADDMRIMAGIHEERKKCWMCELSNDTIDPKRLINMSIVRAGGRENLNLTNARISRGFISAVQLE